MKKIIFTVYTILFSCFSIQAQNLKFNESNFVKYINSIRKAEILRNTDSCSLYVFKTPLCADTLLDLLETRSLPNSVDLFFHYKNKKDGQVFLSISTEDETSLDMYFEDIIKPLKNIVLNEKNKQFVLFHRELENKVVIVFRILKKSKTN